MGGTSLLHCIPPVRPRRLSLGNVRHTRVPGCGCVNRIAAQQRIESWFCAHLQRVFSAGGRLDETRTASNGLMTSSQISDVCKFNLASRGARWFNLDWRDKRTMMFPPDCLPPSPTHALNPLMGTLKPQNNGLLCSSNLVLRVVYYIVYVAAFWSNKRRWWLVIGTLALSGWAVTFGTARRGLGLGGLRWAEKVAMSRWDRLT